MAGQPMARQNSGVIKFLNSTSAIIGRLDIFYDWVAMMMALGD